MEEGQKAGPGITWLGTLQGLASALGPAGFVATLVLCGFYQILTHMINDAKPYALELIQTHVAFVKSTADDQKRNAAAIENIAKILSGVEEEMRQVGQRLDRMENQQPARK